MSETAGAGLDSDQRDWLESLTCERLSARRENLEILYSFEQDRERDVNVLDYAKDFAWDEDSCGDVAYYLVRDSSGVGVFFFSLKCGEMFDATVSDVNPLRNSKRLLSFSKSVQRLLDTSVDADLLKDEIASLMETEGVTYKALLTELFKKHKAKTDYFKTSEEGLAENNQILRVLYTDPCAQLVHVCKNSRYENVWRTHFPTRSIGETMFWWFVVPRLLDIRRLIGCKYLFLFAADKTQDGSLMNFYEASLKFTRDEKHGVNQPLYDWSCFLMSQSIVGLEEKRKYFIDTFNCDHDLWLSYGVD